MTVEIPLNRGYVALIDDADETVVRQFRTWWVKPSSDSLIYAKTDRMVSGRREQLRMHRLILGAAEGTHIDHINGNGLDNRRANLRLATNSQNMMNRPAPSTNKSGYKGVSWHAKGQKWVAMIWKQNRQIYLGLFNDKEDAARAYDDAARRLHGDFARLNFPLS